MLSTSRLSLLTLLLLPFLGKAQSPKWLSAYTVEDEAKITSYSFSMNDYGFGATAATFYTDIILGKDTLKSGGSSVYNPCVIVYDIKGNLVWARAIQVAQYGVPTKIVVDNDSNVYITGSFYGKMTVGKQEFTPPSATYDAFLVKYNSKGDVVWATTATGNSIQQGAEIAVDATGIVYWTGQFYSSSSIGGKSFGSSSGNYRMWVAKIGKTGKTMWVNELYGASGTQAGPIQIKNKRLITSGSFIGSMSIDSKTYYSNGSYDIFIAEFDTAFKPTWAATIGGTSVDYIRAIHIAKNGNVGFTGSFQGSSISFGGKTISGNNGDIYAALFNSSGKGVYAYALNSTASFSSNQPNGIYVDSVNNIYVAGLYYGAVKTGKSSTSASGGSDAFVLGLDKNGAYSWFLSGGAGGNETVNGLKVLPNGYIYVGGYYSGSTKFDKISLSSGSQFSTYIASCIPPIDAPKFKKYPAFSVYYDSTFTGNFKINTSYTPNYKLISGPTGLTFNASDCSVSYTPGYSDLGRKTVVIAADNIAGSDTLRVIIDVIDFPKVAFAMNAAYCVKNQVSYKITAPYAGPLTYTWYLADKTTSNKANPIITYSDTGHYTVSVKITSVDLLIDSGSVDVYIAQLPKASFTINNACINDTLLLQSTSTIAKGSIAQNQWYRSGVLVGSASSVSQFYSASASYKYKLVSNSNFGCVDSISKVVNISEFPEAKFLVISACAQEEALFIDQSSVKNDTIAYYYWNFGDGKTLKTTSQGINHNYAKGGKYKVNLVVETKNNCLDSFQSNVTVYGKPTADFAKTTSPICLGKTISLSDVSTTKEGAITTRRWFMGDSKSYTTPKISHTYTKPGKFTVNLVVSTNLGCSDTASQVISVFAKPKTEIYRNDSCLSKNNIVFSKTTTDAGDPLAKYQWYVDGVKAGNSQNLNYPFSNTAIKYLVKLNVESNTGCKDSNAASFHFTKGVEAIFSVPEACARDTVAIDFDQMQSGLDTTQWIGWGVDVWYSDSTWFARYDTIEQHRLFLRTFSTNGCQDSTFKDLDVKTLPNSRFGITKNELELNVTAQDKTNLVYIWDFGDGNKNSGITSQNTYSLTGTYTIQLSTVGTNGCANSWSRDVTVDISTSMEGNFSDETITLYPNPFSDRLWLSSNNQQQEQTVVSIFDLSGKLVYENKIQIPSGFSKMELNTEGLIPGLYLLKTSSDSQTKQFPILKK